MKRRLTKRIEKQNVGNIGNRGIFINDDDLEIYDDDEDDVQIYDDEDVQIYDDNFYGVRPMEIDEDVVQIYDDDEDIDKDIDEDVVQIYDDDEDIDKNIDEDMDEDIDEDENSNTDEVDFPNEDEDEDGEKEIPVNTKNQIEYIKKKKAEYVAMKNRTFSDKLKNPLPGYIFKSNESSSDIFVGSESYEDAYKGGRVLGIAERETKDIVKSLEYLYSGRISKFLDNPFIKNFLESAETLIAQSGIGKGKLRSLWLLAWQDKIRLERSDKISNNAKCISCGLSRNLIYNVLWQNGDREEILGEMGSDCYNSRFIYVLDFIRTIKNLARSLKENNYTGKNLEKYIIKPFYKARQDLSEAADKMRKRYCN